MATQSARGTARESAPATRSSRALIGERQREAIALARQRGAYKGRIDP